ncbi:MAG: outer membrane protein assembly factor BamB [Candidatus Phlomobacter fragariae]
MQLGRTLLVGLLAATLLMGCSTEKDSIVISPLPEVDNQFIPSIIWHRSIGDGSGRYYSQLSPAYDDSVVYAADRKGTVKAMDVDSGEILWSIDLSQQVGFFTENLPALLSSGLTVSGDKLYIGTETGKVIALSKADGDIAWETDIAGEALSQPVVSDGLVLIHTSNGVLQALDAQTGQSKWSINLGTSTLSVRGKSAPAIAYGVAIIGSDGGRISAVMLAQAQIAWQQYISQIRGATEIERLHDVNMTPVIDINSGAIFAIAYNGDLVAMDMRSSQIIWKRDLGSVNDIIVANDIIYLVDQNDRVLAIRKSDGVTLWTQDGLLHRNLTAPAIYDGYLVIGDGEGYLHWLDTQDGQFVAQNKVDSSGLRSRPVIASDKLLIQGKDGTVYLIER